MGLVLTWPVGRDGTTDRSQAPPFAPVAAYGAGSALGGAVTGLALGLLGEGLRAAGGDTAVGVVAALVAAAGVVCELRGRVSPLPERRAQVPRGWLRFGARSLPAFAFGAIIGTGVLTHVRHAVAYTLAAIALLAPSPWLAVAVGAVYGIGKAAVVLATWVGDRVVGRRPPLPGTAIGRTINRTLALAGLLCFVSVGYLAV